MKCARLNASVNEEPDLPGITNTAFSRGGLLYLAYHPCPILVGIKSQHPSILIVRFFKNNQLAPSQIVSIS